MEKHTGHLSDLIAPRLLQFIERKISEHFGASSPVRVILYGSRARKDNLERSDYDLAVAIPAGLDHKWSRFYLDLVEEAPTLRKVDLVNLARCPKELRGRIVREGKVVYDRTNRAKKR